MQQTSLDAFAAILNLPDRRKMVYEEIAAHGTISDLELAVALNKPINSITPRRNELVKEGLVREAHKSICPLTGKKVIYWEVTQ